MVYGNGQNQHPWCWSAKKANVFKDMLSQKISVRREYLIVAHRSLDSSPLHASKASDTSFHIDCKDQSKWGKTLEQKITIPLLPLLLLKFLLPWLNLFLSPRYVLHRKLQQFFSSYIFTLPQTLSEFKVQFENKVRSSPSKNVLLPYIHYIMTCLL